MKLVLFAPTQKSLYSRLLAHFIHAEDGMELRAIVARSIWSPQRFRAELRRDGPRLLRKIRQKLIIDERFSDPSESDSLSGLARSVDLSDWDLKTVSALSGTPFIQPKDLNDPIVEDCIRGVEADVVVFSGGGLIRRHILEAPTLGVVNCHSGWLPPYRGMDVVEWAILEDMIGQPEIGLTLHFMDRGVDTGPILAWHREKIKADDTIASIRRRLEGAMVPLFMEGLRGLRDQLIRGIPQDPEAGKQYFVMHTRLRDITAAHFSTITSRKAQ